MTREAPVYQGAPARERKPASSLAARVAAAAALATWVASGAGASAQEAAPSAARPASRDLRAARAPSVAAPTPRPRPKRRLGEWIIPRGREEVVRALVGALKDAKGTIAGFALASVRIDFDRVALVLARESPRAAHIVELLHAKDAGPGDIVAGSVAVFAPPGTPPELAEAVRDGLVRHGAKELPWTHQPAAAGTNAGEGRLERSPPFPWWAFATTVGGGVALAAIAAALASWRRRVVGARRK